MLIAIDYDNTFSADVDLWAGFIRDATASGHQVCCVTQRRENEVEMLPDRHIELFRELGVGIYYTCRNGKRKYMADQHGMRPEIWIDDSPESVLENSLWELPSGAPGRETYRSVEHSMR